VKVSGWGRYPVHEAEVTAPRNVAALAACTKRGPLIARGNGRAYGDSAVNRTNTVSMRHFNRMIAFDPERGQLVAESGVLLADVIRAFLPRGWFPAVTPGTKFVTLGGMVAADVHGKNHHRDGSFGAFVDWIDLMQADRSVLRCSRDEHRELFEWTLGGMGLTGVILRVAMRLRPVESGWIRQETIPAPNLEAALAALEGGDAATYSVAWIDCLASGAALGRAHPFDTGRKRGRSVPFDAPPGVLNGLTVRAFNELYYHAGLRKAGEALVDWDTYFYPLDAILGWNRIYGRKGFVQFQCVLPLDQSRSGLEALLHATADAGQGSFLAVLKRFGPQVSRFSFPMAGYTLALDFPVTRRTEPLMQALDRITLDHGGRFYLAKDARMSAATLRAADDRTEDFIDMRKGDGRSLAFRSEQSERLSL
jgi:FAD/FMN-containing dehydrogenase